MFFFHSLRRGGFRSCFDLQSPLCIFFHLSFNLNKWFSHIKFNILCFLWFHHLSVAFCCSSSCAAFDFVPCCGVRLVHFERSTSSITDSINDLGVNVADSFFDVQSLLCIFFHLSFNLNKWLSHIKFNFLCFLWFHHLSAAFYCSSSCAAFDFAPCCGVRLVHFERSTSSITDSINDLGVDIADPEALVFRWLRIYHIIL